MRARRRELALFAAVGLACTAVYAVLFAAVRHEVGPLYANGLALTLTMGLNFAANRWLTFRARGRSVRTEAAQYAAVYLLGLAASTLALDVAIAALDPSRLMETPLAVACGAVATLIRFVLLSTWVFPGEPGAARA
ncbi:MAG: GtrA family protein [Dehalococcoidia bacterium]|nr:GtrA family protein [Dehalococcoidia bacterium]